VFTYGGYIPFPQLKCYVHMTCAPYHVALLSLEFSANKLGGVQMELGVPLGGISLEQLLYAEEEEVQIPPPLPLPLRPPSSSRL